MAPLHLFAAAYVVGVLVGACIPTPVPASAGVALLACALAAWRVRTGRPTRGVACLLLVAACSSGAAGYGACMAPGRWDPSRLPSGTKVAVLGRLLRDTPGDLDRATTALHGIAARVGDEVVPVRGDLVVRATDPPPVTSGDRVVVVGRMQRLRRAGPGGGFDAAQYYARRFGAFAQVAGASVLPAPAAWDWSPADLRALIVRRTRELSRDPAHPLRCEVMLSMVFGAPSAALSDATLDRFRRAGTIHVLVVSGAQISILAALAAWLSGMLRLSGWTEVALAAILVLAYAALLPPEGSIMRALGLLAVLHLGRVFHRDTEILSALLTGAFLIVCCSPTMLFSLSFQLSVAAVLGVIVGTRVLGPGPLPSPRLRPARWAMLALWALLAASVGATLATTPLIARTFGTVSVIGPLANLLVVPPAAVLTALMFVSAPLAVVAPPLAQLLNTAGGWLAEAVLWCSETAGSQPWACVGGNPWPWWWVLASYLVLAGGSCFGLRWRSSRGR
jgi:competence protein ComEC